MPLNRSASAPILRCRASTVSNPALAAVSAVEPIAYEAFAARLSALQLDGGLAIAVSGGRDSMALARLAARYAQETGAAVLALTVDHGLRPQSASEAAQTAQWCKAAGLAHRTLSWTGDKPTTGIQEAARHARYRLLAAACNEAGIGALLTAHSASDQAETFFMRLARGAGPSGLSVMLEESQIAAGAGALIHLIRPLLDYSRPQLTATVNAFEQAFIDDPSNDDPAYERIRMRALLARLEEDGALSTQALLRTIARQRDAARRLRDQEEALFRHTAGCFYSWGGASLCADAVRHSDSDAMAGLCRRLIHAVSGEAYAPDEDKARSALHAALQTGAATAGGALIKLWQDRLWFLREPAAVVGRTGVPAIASVTLEPGQAILWDNRFIITGDAAGPGAVVKPLALADPDQSAARTGLFSGPREGLAGLPGVFAPDAGGEAVLISAPALLSAKTAGFSGEAQAAARFYGAIIRF
jgi:tRNA(Ile)-lysidine synthase